MNKGHNPKLRFGISLQAVREPDIRPGIANGPPLPAVNYGLVGKDAPVLVPTPEGELPNASAVVITWADAEWAALQHVFCAGGSNMQYRERSCGTWPGWSKYSKNLPSGRPADWTYWGYYRLVQVSGNAVLLFKSNMHLDWPGATYLQALTRLFVAEVKPNVILSIGTAGGAKTQDHLGTVRAASAGTLYESGQPPASWLEYKNKWTASSAVLEDAKFRQLLFPGLPRRLTFKRSARSLTSTTAPATRWRNWILMD